MTWVSGFVYCRVPIGTWKGPFGSGDEMTERVFEEEDTRVRVIDPPERRG